MKASVTAGDIRRADTVQKLLDLMHRPRSKKNHRAIVAKIKQFQYRTDAVEGTRYEGS